MAKKDLLYTIPKLGTEVVKRTLKKTLRAKYGHVITKGTEVTVTIETTLLGTYYRVAYPGSDVLCLSANESDFEF
jgi:hypothetical protein